MTVEAVFLPKKQIKKGEIMLFLNVDFSKGMTTLFKESFKFKKYKAMHPFFAVVVGLCQIPYVLISFLVAAIIYVFDFIAGVLAYPIEQVHGLIRREKNEVRGAAEAIIYFLSWPFLFFFYILLTFMTFMLNVLYVIAALSTFIWSLGGFKFHLFLARAGDIKKDVKGKYHPAVSIVFTVIMGVLFILLPIILGLITFATQTEPEFMLVPGTTMNQLDALGQPIPNPLYEDFGTCLGGAFALGIVICSVFSLLYTLIAYAPFPRVKETVVDADPAEAAPAVEAFVEEAYVEETYAEAAPVEEAPVEEAPAEEAPVEEVTIEGE
jgi:hypothetical protein